MQENGTLIERLKRQHEEQNAIIQSLTQQQLEAMRNELSATFQRELNTTKAAIEQQTRGIGWNMLKNKILWPSVTGLSLSLGILLGSWGTMQYLLSEITEARQTLKTLEQEGGKAQISKCDTAGRLCIKIDLKAQAYGKNGEFRIIEGY